MTDSEKWGMQDKHAPLRSFGRRRARKLSPRQTSLLNDGLRQYALDLSTPPPEPLTDLFQEAREIWLEIGFGGGEHLLWQAQQNANVGFLACEPFIDGVVKVIDGAVTQGLVNIRIHADDARDVIDWMPVASISRTFVLFPDPWPKKRHVKRRLIDPNFIGQLGRIMRPKGELRLATDIPDYARGMLVAVRKERSFRWLAREAGHWRKRPPDWPETRYEQKALREGRKRYFLTFVRQGLDE